MYTPDSSIIDNRKLKLFEELNKILQEQKVLDIANGYFNLSGFQLVKDEIKNIKKFRLLIGRVPEIDDKKIPDLFEPYQYYTGLIKTDLEDQDFKKENKTAAIDFIKFLKKPSIEVRLYDRGFLHGKAYIFEKIAIIGSSNFTYSGLTSNAELFDARFAFLVSTQEIPEEIKKLSKIVFSFLSLPAYKKLVLVQFDKDQNKFIDWFEENPFEIDYYWK